MRANKPPNFKSPPDNGGGKKNTLGEIQRLQRERDERRMRMEQAKVERAAEDQRNKDSGNPGDVDFQRMIRVYRQQSAPPEQPHADPGESKICICVRKRPISTKEIKRQDFDSVSCFNPQVVVHDCKMKVDGISKYLDNASFAFDHTFNEEDSTDDIYHYAVQPLVPFVLTGGRATVFAYGQTGSGKTFTMQGVQAFVAQDLFDLIERHDSSIKVFVSYFEIYGGRCQDLLNSRQRLNVREDGAGDVVVSDLMELQAGDADALHGIIETGNRNRTTHATESNDESSRSHAICQIALRREGGGAPVSQARAVAGYQNKAAANASTDELVGRLSLIDLAGSERGADTKSHNRQRRMEGAEINKSLLALKECIRALDTGSSHVPYRASKLTLVLKDSFTRPKARTVMIANISPAASSADHTINTLRYADRIKERVVGAPAKPAARNNADDAKGGGAALLRRQSSDNSVGSTDRSALPSAPVENNIGNVKDRHSRNKEIQKVLAENISAPSSPKGPSKKAPVIMPPPSPLRDAGKGGLGGRAESKFGGGGGGRGAKGGYDEDDDGYSDVHLHPRGRGVRDSYEAEEEQYGGGGEMTEEEAAVDALSRTVQDIFEEEESLLNLHMGIIQENAELLTEEGRLLQQIQGENNDIDAYAARLDQILRRKQTLIGQLRDKLDHFRASLAKEEAESTRLRG